jgi:amino acid transporter
MSTYVGTVVWAFGGFDSLGSIAGEVRDEKREMRDENKNKKIE